MRVVGIVAEYNPFHNGHQYHLEEAMRLTGADACIVALSGNFVQRGEPACTDKYTRAEWAMQGGADLVVEIPSCFAVASAERYAEGAIRTLAATGVVTDLAFGVETDDLTALYRIVELLDREPANFRVVLTHHLKQGKSYPRAQYDALRDFGVPSADLAILEQPNNILAIEYLKCIRRFAPHIRPCPILRRGNQYHDLELNGVLSSATSIRRAIKEGDPRVYEATPLFVSGAIRFDPQFPLSLNDMGPMILMRLRTLSVLELSELPDVSEGFEQVLWRAVRQAATVDELLELIKSKRYTMARCKRILIAALLGITRDLTEGMRRDRSNFYLRILTRRKNGHALLSAIASAGCGQVLLRNADLEQCTPLARRSIAIDALATDLVAYALGKEVHRDAKSAIMM